MPEQTISVLRTVDDRVIPVAGIYEIDAASVSTGNDDRDAHLKSGDFFDIEHHPITFTSTAAVQAIATSKAAVA